MDSKTYPCPNCAFLTVPDETQGMMFECANCGATLKVAAKDSINAMRVFMLAAMLYFGWRHGWDHGFVQFFMGLYSVVGLAFYLFSVYPVFPIELKLVTRPICRKYLDVEPLSNEVYESRVRSDKPLGIT